MHNFHKTSFEIAQNDYKNCFQSKDIQYVKQLRIKEKLNEKVPYLLSAILVHSE